MAHSADEAHDAAAIRKAQRQANASIARRASGLDHRVRRLHSQVFPADKEGPRRVRVRVTAYFEDGA